MTSKNYSSSAGPTPVSIPSILARKNQKKISCVTAYDYTSARMVDAAGIDIILVGDSLAGVIQGEKNTLPVTLEQMVYHTRCVAAGAARALVVADLPFMTYQISEEQAIETSFKLIKFGNASAVKLEGGVNFASTIKKITSMDVPVMGHVGLTPQSIHRIGGFKVQGKEDPKRIIDDAIAVAEAGAFAVVVEGVPNDVAKTIRETINIPVIGIGAGVDCDGQILVLHDLLGMHGQRVPRFVKQYAQIFDDGVAALERYREEVESATFPSLQYSYGDRLHG